MKAVLIFFLLFSAMNLNAEKSYYPNSGDKELNKILINLNNKKINQNKFIKQLSLEFNVPDVTIKKLYTHYEMTTADVIMCVSVADVSGQPLNTVSGLYFKNKQGGWSIVLDKLNISKNSMVFEQIKKDVKLVN